MNTEKKIAYWKPHPKQNEALQSPAYEILYGGARGGGKTDCGMAWLTKEIQNPMLRCLVIRRNYDDLKDWIDRAREFYRPLTPEFTLSNKTITFPSGAKIMLGHLNDDGAYTKYQGHEYQRMLIEELTHIPSEELYLKLVSSCRSTVPGLAARIFSTTNPGEAGHKWVRKRFVDVTHQGEVYRDPSTGRSRLFIQSMIEDNPTLMEADPEYVKFLEGLPDGLRQQWRDGSWDDIEIKGSYYIQQIKQAQVENRICKLPYDDTIPVDLYFDIGISKTDQMTCWFKQKYGKENRILESRSWVETSLTKILKEIGTSRYQGNFGMFYFPHDIMVREFSDGKTRKDTVDEFAKIHGFKVEVVPAMNPQERIHATRIIFATFWFDELLCEEGLDALRNYRKEYDEKNLVFKENPLHNWASHYADSFGIIGVTNKDDAPHFMKKIPFHDLGAREEEDEFGNPFGL